jgi:hypothetical protein
MVESVEWDIDKNIPVYTEDWLKMQGTLLLWSACPVCLESWNEEIPEIGHRQSQLNDIVIEFLTSLARKHKIETHDGRFIRVGIERISGHGTSE